MVLRRALLFAGACALGCGVGGACGGGVTPGDSAEKPLKSYPATGLASPALSSAARPILGVLWSDPSQQRPDVLMPRDWLATDLSSEKVTADPASGNLPGFTVDFFRPPPPAAIVRITTPDGSDFADLALADVVMVDDKDGDGDYRPSGVHAEIGPDDSYIAGLGQALLYVARPFSRGMPANFPLAYPHTGYSLVDFQCSGLTGQTSRGVIESFGMLFVAQPSQRLPEIRNCLRTHSP